MIELKKLIPETIIQGTNVVPSIMDSLPAIKRLGTKSFLTRTFSGVRMGAAEIISGPIEKGRIGYALHPNSPVYNKEISDLFNNIINKYNLKHIVYCSHGGARFALGGDEYIMVPVGDYKTIWSPKVNDIYRDASEMQSKGKLDKFPIQSYKNAWPSGRVSEILVDCKSYFLITLRIPIVQDYMKKNRINGVNNYKQLYDVLVAAIEPYKKNL